MAICMSAGRIVVMDSIKKEWVERQLEGVLTSLNLTLKHRLSSNGLLDADSGELKRPVRARFDSKDHVAMTMDVDTDMTVSLTRGRKTLKFTPNEAGYSYENPQKMGIYDVYHALQGVNAQMRAGDVSFTFASGHQKIDQNIAYSAAHEDPEGVAPYQRKLKKDRTFGEYAVEQIGFDKI